MDLWRSRCRHAGYVDLTSFRFMCLTKLTRWGRGARLSARWLRPAQPRRPALHRGQTSRTASLQPGPPRPGQPIAALPETRFHAAPPRSPPGPGRRLGAEPRGRPGCGSRGRSPAGRGGRHVRWARLQWQEFNLSPP